MHIEATHIDRRLSYVLIAVTGEITHHLAAAGRMSDVNRIPQVEMVSDGLQIVGIMVRDASKSAVS